jgi:hypothetical protein
MRVLVACEFSGVVREAFRSRGHDAWSCDLLPAEDCSPFHYQEDVFGVVNRGWDLMIAHPPCTHLASSGARWFSSKTVEQAQAVEFFEKLAAVPIPRMALENPISVISTRLGPPTQIIQPWQFGHGETKATCLWLHWLPSLVPTNVVDGRAAKVLLSPDSKGRWKKRSRTYQGVADAMADQWGGLS